MPHDVMEIEIGDRITFTYKNWKGEVAQRTAVVEGFMWGMTEWHPKPGLLLEGMCIDRGERRLFAVGDISNVEKVDG